MSVDLNIHFKEYRDNKQRIEEAVYQVKELESSMYSVRAVSYRNIPSINTTYTDSTLLQTFNMPKHFIDALISYREPFR